VRQLVGVLAVDLAVRVGDHADEMPPLADP